MANLTGSPILVPLETTYRDYFSCTDTNTSRCRYATILAPYVIYLAASTTPAEVSRLLYTADQEGVPTALLQWYQVNMVRGAQIALLRMLSS